MAAEIKPATNVHNSDRFSNDGKKPELISKLEGFTGDINAAIIVSGGEVVITASDDRHSHVRVWLRRDTGQYWPSICHSMGSGATAISYIPATMQLFVGVESGLIEEFVIGNDYNQMQSCRRIESHEGRISGLEFSIANSWIISTSFDKVFQYHCTKTGRRVGSYIGEAIFTALQFDKETNHAFVADYSGQIIMFKLEPKGCQVVTTFKAGRGSIKALHWCATERLLFSGGFENVVSVFDIGGNAGVSYRLHGHQNKVTGLNYVVKSKQLFSGGTDSVVIAWDMAKPRQSEEEWRESDDCERCKRPFFWNWKAIINARKLEVARQHHCRNCGAAVCDACSINRLSLPARGYELDVRICSQCFESIRNSMSDTASASSSRAKESYAIFHDARHSITCLDFDPKRNLLLTAGQDRVIKLWDVTPILTQ